MERRPRALPALRFWLRPRWDAVRRQAVPGTDAQAPRRRGKLAPASGTRTPPWRPWPKWPAGATPARPRGCHRARADGG
eukprot:11186907-Lingulodinium_polyedra.AAC.1